MRAFVKDGSFGIGNTYDAKYFKDMTEEEKKVFADSEYFEDNDVFIIVKGGILCYMADFEVDVIE